MVVVSADDPGMHSSQNEQDNRNYAKFARVPLLEPSDSGEAKDFMVAAFELSERFDTPGAVPHHHPHLPLQEPGDTGRAGGDGAGGQARAASTPSTS